MQENRNTGAPALLSFEEQCRRLLRGPRAGDAVGTVVMLVLSGLAKLNFECPSRYYMRHEDLEYEDIKTGARCYINIDIGDRLAQSKARNFRLFAELAIESASEAHASIRFGLRMEQYLAYAKGPVEHRMLAEFERNKRVPKADLAAQFGAFAAELRDNDDDATSSFRASVLESMAP